MVERLPSDAELDALIEAALAEDVVLPVPRDLHARVCERIQLAALQQRELARFRNALLSGFAASVSIIATLAALVLFTKFDVLLKHGISGGQGLLDSYAATFALSWPYYLEAFALALVLGLGGATVWAGLMPLRWIDAVHGRESRKPVAPGPFQTP
ncbi:MAG: hypothetical protein JNK74_06500 [Candidatus Hydrogenedentes bacterium]|nr:hypothetical protein [Candidatus Hydrogenedentota bacterium]